MASDVKRHLQLYVHVCMDNSAPSILHFSAFNLYFTIVFLCQSYGMALVVLEHT